MNNMIRKTILAAFLAILWIGSFASTQAAAAAKFTDVPEQYAQEIEYLVQKGVAQGKTDTTFGSNEKVTRQEAATFLGRALGLNGTPGKTKFPDVKQGTVYSGYIKSAVEAGIITGDTNGKFRPTDTITRGEIAFLLTRAFHFKETGNVFYKDLPANTPKDQLDAIKKITTAGITKGEPDGTYGLKVQMNRIDFAVFVARALNPEFRVTYENATIGSKYVQATELNVRSGPSTNDGVVGVLKQNEKVDVYAHVGSWSYITNGTITGYVSNTYLADTQYVKPTPTPPVTGKHVVAIDAGHGGKDPGASANGLREKDINLDVALRVEKKLKERGITVVMTRRTDIFHELGDRVKIAQDAGADTFVSIHTNSFTPSANGTETYYYNTNDTRGANSKKLATIIQNKLYKEINTSNRGVKSSGFQVIKYNKLPAVLVELAFVTNTSDAEKLGSDYYKNLMAEAIADGIEEYYRTK